LTDDGFPLRSEVREHRLDNGLTVLLCVDHRSPVVSIVTHVRAGYFDESDDVAGISHVLEHMFFKGTNRRGPGDIARETKSLGGYLNAGTIYDHTSYYTVVPSSELEQALELQSDALLHSTIDAGELEREMRVIIQESKRKLDSPMAVAHETLLETMFDRHRIRRWRIGTEAGLERLTRDDVLGFYRNLYRAPNVVLCVAGDIEAGATLRLVDRFYGGMDAEPPVRDRGPAEPPRTGFRFRDVAGDVAQTCIQLGWRTPGIVHPDAPLLDLAAIVLGQGRAARLYRGVREQGLVTLITAAASTPGDLGVFTVSAVSQPDDAIPALDAIHAVLDGVHEGALLDVELERARNMLEAGLIARFERVEGQASLLAEWQARGDWRLFRDYWTRLISGSADDVARAVRSHLTMDSATALLYHPASPESIEWSPAATLAPAAVSITPDAVSAPPIPATPATGAELEIEDAGTGVRMYHGPGSRIALLPRREVPLVSMAVAFAGGAAEEDPAHSGLSALLARTSIKGTASRNAAELADAGEAMGGFIVPVAGADSIEWSITVPSKHAAAALDLLVDVVRQATFPEAELDRERKVMLGALRLLRDNMFSYPMRLFLEAAFESDAYGHAIEVEEAAVAKVDRAALTAWHGRVVRERQPLVLLVGDVDADIAARAAASDVRGAEPLEEPEPASWPAGPRRRIVERDTAQSALVIGFRGPDRNHPDADAFKVMAAAIAGLGGRLFEELRSRRSLAYTVAARPIARRRAGAFTGYIATSPDREDEARAALIEELMKLTVDPLPEEEVDRARRFLIGTHRIQGQTNRARLNEIGTALLLGGGLEEVRNFEDRIREVTPAAIRDAAARWFDEDRIVEGMVRGTGRSR